MRSIRFIALNAGAMFAFGLAFACSSFAETCAGKGVARCSADGLAAALPTNGDFAGDPVVTYWAGPGFPGHPEKLTERAAQQLKEGGFNLVWTSSPEELDVAQKFGLRALYNLQLKFLDVLNEAAKAEIERRILSVMNHPALYLYHHADEPAADVFGRIAAAREWVARIDPNHPLWTNLFPIYSWNKQLKIDEDVRDGYREYLRLFCDIYRPDFLSYDHYQFNVSYDMGKYFKNLDLVREAASDRCIPFMNGVQACSWKPGNLVSPDSPRVPGPDELRYLVYTTLAYGAQGIYYYVYSHPKHVGSIADLDGRTGDKYEELKTLNRAFVTIAKELRKVRFRGGYAQGQVPLGVTPFGYQALLKLEPEIPSSKPGRREYADSTLVTRFEAKGRPTHLMVVNLDYRKDRMLTVTAPADVEQFGDQTGVWTPQAKSGERFGLPLRRGEGVLLRLAKKY